MDLNVKLQGLKYNFGKGQGCFCKSTVLWDFLDFFTYFTKENPWNRFTNAWTGSTPLAHGAPNRN
jgi:hypothetical protein